MKILDRYVLLSFLRDYLISFLVLIGTYIVLDMVIAFDELFEFRGVQQLSSFDVAWAIADYYFHQAFLIFVHLSGVIPVVAAAFTLIRMSRFNELSAILAAGVPLLRVAAPILIATVALQVLLAVDQEVIIPRMVAKLTPAKDEIYRTSSAKSFPVQAMQDEFNALLFAGKYEEPGGDKTRAILREVDIIERDAELRPLAHTTAERAEWDRVRQQWNLAKGRKVEGLLPDQQRGDPKTALSYKSNITPDEITLWHSGEYVNLLSRERINQLLERPQIYGANNLLRVKHFRLSQLIMNFVMVAVAIPCVLTREPGRLKNSIARCLVLVGLCMAGYFVAYQIAGFPPAGWGDRWPAMLAFAPVIVFSVVAVFLLDRLANKNT